MSKLSRRELAKRVVEGHWQRQHATIPLVVNGESMGSAVPHGSTVRVAFHERPRLHRGDIVYLRRGDMRVVHRLVAVLGPLCIERGDAARRARLCLRSSILGTVIDVD
ncbi:MAG: S24 family peptidase [Candidatus Hydrogenedentes bacterium]|nr:S24 family peptidase [Candidatus Hydrogenedentota bacterium]